jgi:2-C-methyl-D-erythritol 4-phosphate cytidylyltransferase
MVMIFSSRFAVVHYRTLEGPRERVFGATTPNGNLAQMQCDAVILAGGSSARFGGNKLAVELCGQPALAWSLCAFEAASSARSIVVVASAGTEQWAETLGRACAPTKFLRVATGGVRRRDSVEAGVRACSTRYVAIHDGARPLIEVTDIERCIAAAEGLPGAILAVPVVDTIKQVENRTITGHPDRVRLWAAQTPQVVLRQAWLDAAAASDNDETDDASMLSRLGLECVVVEGNPTNIKITLPLDLEIARLIMAERLRQ